MKCVLESKIERVWCWWWRKTKKLKNEFLFSFLILFFIGSRNALTFDVRLLDQGDGEGKGKERRVTEPITSPARADEEVGKKREREKEKVNKKDDLVFESNRENKSMLSEKRSLSERSQGTEAQD